MEDKGVQTAPINKRDIEQITNDARQWLASDEGKARVSAAVAATKRFTLEQRKAGKRESELVDSKMK